MTKEEFELFLIGELKIAPSHEAWDYCCATYIKVKENFDKENKNSIKGERL